jgi:hypothetical protein
MTRSTTSYLRSRPSALALAALVGSCILPRLSHIGREYYLDFHGWRQSDSAAFTNGYLQGSFKLWEPAVDRQPCKLKRAPFGRAEAELPIVAYLAAAPLRLLGHERASPIYLRSIAIAVFACGCWLLFACVRELGGSEVAGLLSVAAFGAAPLAIFFTRSPQPDGHSLSFAIGTVLCLERYLNSRRTRDIALTGVFAAVLLLSKVSNAYLGIVLVYMVVSRAGWGGLLRDVRLWIAGSAALAVAALWYWHAHSFPWTFGIWRADEPLDRKFSDLAVLSDVASWRRLGTRLGWDILTPVGALLTALGLSQVRVRWVRVAAVWLLSASLFVVATMYAQLRHAYYQLCLIPPAAILAGAGMRWLTQRARWGRPLLAALALAHAAVAYAVLWGTQPTSTEGRPYFAENQGLVQTVEAIRRHVPAGAMIVSSERDPRLYLNSQHRGFFGKFRRPADALRCMNNVGDYLVLGARARASLARAKEFRAAFEERWRGDYYSLYQRTPRP